MCTRVFEEVAPSLCSSRHAHECQQTCLHTWTPFFVFVFVLDTYNIKQCLHKQAVIVGKGSEQWQ